MGPDSSRRVLRVQQRIVGVDEQFIWLGSPSDPDFMIEQAPPDVTLELAIAAVNSGGQGPWSEVITVRTGVMAAPESAPRIASEMPSQ